MKLLLTSDWHMAGYRDPACRINRSNDDILRLLDRWEADYALILLNGDIFESLKSSRVRFDHDQHTQRIIEARRPLVARFLQHPYIWTVGNHDYPLEQLLTLPMSVHRQLDHGLQLFAEHGHLLRAERAFYSDYHTIYHLLYCSGWWSSRVRRQLGIPGDSGDSMEALLHFYWRTTATQTQTADSWLSRAMKAVFARLSLQADSNLPAFFTRSVEDKYQTADSLITMGHSHYYQCVPLSGARIYVNTGRGYRQGRICAVEFDTESRTARRVNFEL